MATRVSVVCRESLERLSAWDNYWGLVTWALCLACTKVPESQKDVVLSINLTVLISSVGTVDTLIR